MPDVGLYIGSRHDIIPLLVFPEMKRWIYIDSLPIYKAGFEEDKYPKHLKKEMYLRDVCLEVAKTGYVLSERNDKERFILFKNGVRESEIYYFHSTFFPKCSYMQRRLMKDVNYLYLSAYCPERIVLNMVCKTKPLTLLIWHVPLFYNWRKGDSVIDFENDKNLTTFLLFNYVENVNYVYLNDKNTDNDKSLREQIRNNKNLKLDPSSVEKIPCINLLDYHQKETKTYTEQPHYFKTLKDVPFTSYRKNISIVQNRKKRKWFKRKFYTRRK
jgi:hypothetical protein